MATSAQIMALRLMVGEPDDTDPWTDAVLSDIIDAAADMNAAALAVWEGKAAASAGFVDTTESGSTRRMSQVFDQATKMAAYYRGNVSPATEPTDLSGYAYTVGIERP